MKNLVYRSFISSHDKYDMGFTHNSNYWLHRSIWKSFPGYERGSSAPCSYSFSENKNGDVTVTINSDSEPNDDYMKWNKVHEYTENNFDFDNYKFRCNVSAVRRVRENGRTVEKSLNLKNTEFRDAFSKMMGEFGVSVDDISYDGYHVIKGKNNDKCWIPVVEVQGTFHVSDRVKFKQMGILNGVGKSKHLVGSRIDFLPL